MDDALKTEWLKKLAEGRPLIYGPGMSEEEATALLRRLAGGEAVVLPGAELQ